MTNEEIFAEYFVNRGDVWALMPGEPDGPLWVRYDFNCLVKVVSES